MAEKKQAVDQSAKDYWTTYFGEYGQVWVKDVPMRIKAALGAGDGDRVIPLNSRSWAKTAEGGLIFEGVVDSGDKGRRTFRADFRSDGGLARLETHGA